MNVPRRSTARAGVRSQRGAAALEWVIVAPLVVAVICAMVAGWRLQSARAAAAHAADAAARAASWERNAVAASTAGERVARSNLAESSCRDVRIQLDTSGFAIPAGQAASVRADVACVVPLSDLLVPGLPGSIAIAADATTPIDRYRGRG